MKINFFYNSSPLCGQAGWIFPSSLLDWTGAIFSRLTDNISQSEYPALVWAGLALSECCLVVSERLEVQSQLSLQSTFLSSPRLGWSWRRIWGTIRPSLLPRQAVSLLSSLTAEIKILHGRRKTYLVGQEEWSLQCSDWTTWTNT